MNNITLLRFNYNFIAQNNLALNENTVVRKFRTTAEANQLFNEDVCYE